MPTQIIPYIFYRDLDTALAFLATAFGFVETLRQSTPGGGVHAEMALDGQPIMMGQSGRDPKLASALEAGVRTQGVFVWIAYFARDPDGHPWFFTEPKGGGG